MPPAPAALTDAQRLHLQVVFGCLLTEAEEKLEELNRRVSESLPSNHPLLESIGLELGALIRRLRHTADDLAIFVQPRPRDPYRQLVAWSNTWWLHVMDCRPSALKGYGEVDPKLEPVLLPAVNELAGALLRLEGLARRMTESDREE